MNKNLNSETQKINLCSSFGDPTVPGVWSGTPCNIYLELKKRNQVADTFSTDIPFWIKLPLSVLTILVYGKNETYRATFRRYACAIKCWLRTRLSVSSNTLSLGSLSFPFPVNTPRQNHYLLTDSTWDLWSRHSESAKQCPEKSSILFDKLDKLAFTQAKHVFSISQYVKDNLVKHYAISPEKITVVGTGLGIIEPYYGEKDYSNRKILFAAVNRFIDKGGNLVIEAFQKALKSDPKLELTIVGSEEARKFENLPNTKVLGFIPLNDLQELFNTHSLFLMPALNEPWGLVYLEAMACKMPIMGLNRNSFPEISGCGKYGFILEEETSDEIANSIVDAFKNLEKLEEMGKKGQIYCLENFSWTKTVDRILEVVNRGE
jgi:glycosyltransferase involved in cell wall biosynthesis